MTVQDGQGALVLLPDRPGRQLLRVDLRRGRGGLGRGERRRSLQHHLRRGRRGGRGRRGHHPGALHLHAAPATAAPATRRGSAPPTSSTSAARRRSSSAASSRSAPSFSGTTISGGFIFVGQGPGRLENGETNPNAKGLMITGLSGSLTGTAGSRVLSAEGTVSLVGIPGLTFTGNVKLQGTEGGSRARWPATWSSRCRASRSPAPSASPTPPPTASLSPWAPRVPDADLPSGTATDVVLNLGDAPLPGRRHRLQRHRRDQERRRRRRRHRERRLRARAPACRPTASPPSSS